MKRILTVCRIPAIALALGACAASPSVSNVAPCTGYCASYEEGYQWARASNLSDARHCQGYPADFEQGCADGVQDLNRTRPSREGY